MGCALGVWDCLKSVMTVARLYGQENVSLSFFNLLSCAKEIFGVDAL